MTGPQGRSNELAPDLGRYVSRLENVVYKGIASEATPYDLSPLDVYLLMICMEMGECTATQLAVQLPVDASRISRMVTGLVDRGLLRRRRLRSDRRIVMLRLSENGNTVTSEVTERMQSYYDKLTEGLDEREMRAFAATALRIVANYEAMQES